MDQTEWLNDNHITCAQILIKQIYPTIRGLQSTIRQNSGPLAKLYPGSLQVLHVDGNHWALASTISLPNGADILLYDSLYTSMNHQTKLLLSELVHTSKPAFTVGFANLYKQSGTADCGLFAVAYCTDLAFGKEPCHYIYNQAEMRGHLLKCFQQMKLEPFATLRERKVTNSFRFIPVKVHCYCRRTDYYGSQMYFCDGVCGQWFHHECVTNPPARSEKFYCNNCSHHMAS